MVTDILFDLCLFKHVSPVANFGYQSLLLGGSFTYSAQIEKMSSSPEAET